MPVITEADKDGSMFPPSRLIPKSQRFRVPDLKAMQKGKDEVEKQSTENAHIMTHQSNPVSLVAQRPNAS